jgi:hypothetical protein
MCPCYQSRYPAICQTGKLARLLLVLPCGLLAAPNHLVIWGEGADIVEAPRVLSGSSGMVLQTTIRNQPTTADYYAGDEDPEDRSVRFIATAFTDSAEAGARADVRVANNHAPTGEPFDTIQFAIDAGAAVPQSAGGIVLWQKGDGFLNDFSTVAVAFERLAITVVGNRNTAPVAGGTEMRIVVRNGESAYSVSNNIGAFPVGGNGWGELTAAAAQSWFSYDPTVDAGMIGEPVEPVLDDITAVGLLHLIEDQGMRRFFNTHVRRFAVEVLPRLPNQAPVAGDDTAAVFAGRSARIAVLENDTDPDGDPVRITAVATPAVGAATIDGREVVYSAPDGFSGVVEFGYTIADVYGFAAAGRITIAVSEAPPVYAHTLRADVGGVAFSWTVESYTESLASGAFIDGQPWVVVPQGGLRLIDASPARERRSGAGNWVEDRAFNEIAADINITVINPPVGDYYEDVTAVHPRLAFERAAFGWDSRGAIRYGTGRRYDASLGWDGVTPVALQAGDSVTTPQSFISMLAPNGRAHSTALEAVAVLTVLAGEPPADAFRPGVVRTPERRAQPVWIRYADLIPELDERLINLPATNLYGTPLDFGQAGVPAEFTAARLTSLMPGPLIMNIGFNDSEGTHGYVNNSGATYSADIARLMGDLAMGAQAAWLTPEQRRVCRIRFLQRTIDAYEALLAGLCLSHDGGMMTAFGMRLAMAGHMLNYTGMRAMDREVHGLPPWYYLSDYAQVVYLGDPFIPGRNGPPVDSPRFVPWNSPDLLLKLPDVPVEYATATAVKIPDSYSWPFYRPVRELPNIKLRIGSGAGSGATVYTVTAVDDYLNPTPEFGEFSPAVAGGRLHVTPAWQNGLPDHTSALEFLPAVRSESNRWIFKSWGIYRPNRYVILNRSMLSLSPKTDYGTNNIGGYISMVIAMHAMGAQWHYSAGVDQWMIQISGLPGYGEVMFNDDRSRFAADPVVRQGLMERSLLGGLWKEVVLDPSGVEFHYSAAGLAGLPPARPGVPGDTIGNGLADAWELSHFGYLGVDPLADADGDGQSNWLEFMAGTDPLNSASTFRTTVFNAGDQWVVQFPTNAGTIYTLSDSTDLLEWFVQSAVGGDGHSKELPLGPSLQSGFWRIGLSSPYY